MQIRVVYPDVKGNVVDPTSIIGQNFEDLEAAGKYITQEVDPKFSSITSRQIEDYRTSVAAHATSGNELARITKGETTTIESTTELIPIKLPYQIAFFEHEDKNGDHFDLGVIQKVDPLVVAFPLLGSCDWDSDLDQRRPGPNNGTWNDAITSLNCNIFDKYWAMFEHSHFRGQVLIGRGDVNSLNNPHFFFPDGSNANDRISSIVMCSTPAPIIEAAIQALITGGA